MSRDVGDLPTKLDFPLANSCRLRTGRDRRPGSPETHRPDPAANVHGSRLALNVAAVMSLTEEGVKSALNESLRRVRKNCYA